MLKVLRRGSRWLMWIVILLVGGAFVFFLGIGGGFGGGTVGPTVVVDVDGRSYSVRDVDRIRRRQEEEYRRALGDDFDAAGAADYLDEIAAGSLVRFGLLAHEGERMGLRVTDQEIRDYLRALPGAADEQGRLDQDVLTNYAEREYGSVRRFQEALRDELLARKASRLLNESVAVSTGEALDALRYEREEVSIAYVAIDRTIPPADAEISEDRVTDLIETEPDRIRLAYEERRDEYDLPERVRARHILIRVPADADEEKEEALRAEAQRARTRIVDGADFADVALEVSQDPGSKFNGGDLGFFPRGKMVKPFEDVAFGLEPGVVSDVVKSVHGFHVIRVEEKKEAELTPLEDVQEVLARELVGREIAERAARARMEALADQVRGGSSVIDAARADQLVVERPDPIRRRPDGQILGLGLAPDVMTAAFTLRAEAPSSDRVFEVGDKLVLIQLLERTVPTDEELEPEVTARRQEMLLERRNQLESSWVETRRVGLTEDGKLIYNLSALQER